MNPASSTQARVVEAASHLFARRGYAATSIADIAQAAGLLKGNLAYYFKTKQDLLGAVLAARADALRAELRGPAAADESARMAVERLLDHVRRSADALARDGCPLGSLSTELGKSDEGLHAGAAALLLELQDFLREAFAGALPADQADEAAEQLLALLQGAAVLAQAKRDPGVVHRQLAVASAWLDALLPAPRRAQKS